VPVSVGVVRGDDAEEDRERDSKRTLEYGEGEGDGIGEVTPCDTQSSSNDKGEGLVAGGEVINERLGKGTR
jgi:hypothetical protein